MVRNDESFQTCDRKCDFPSIGLQSLVAFQAFQNDLGSFEEYVKIGQTVLEKYLDHRYLPTMKSDKKRKVDVMTYRIRQPNDSVGCIMASYGSQHEFSEENLLTKGLFGSLLQDGDRVRFFSGAEVLILMMPCQTVFLPKDRKLHMKIVGNGITSAHAILALSFAIRALGFCDSPCADPTQMVLETLKRRMHFGNISIQEFADGWRICKKDEAIIDIPMNIDISDTIRDDRFQKAKIFSGHWNVLGFTEPFIDARDVIRSLGMKDDFITRVYQTSDALIIQVKQPMVLPLLQIKWGNVNSEFIMVLIQGKFVLLRRTHEMTVDDLLDYLIHQGVTRRDKSIVANMAGVPLGLHEKPSSLIMIVSSHGTHKGCWEGELPKFVTSSGNIFVKCFRKDALRLVLCFNIRGITDFCAMFGWFVQVEHECDLFTKVSFVRRTQKIVITTEVFQSMLALWIVPLLMPPNQIASDDNVMITVKFYGLQVWQGYLSRHSTVGDINLPWNRAVKAFGVDCPIRCVILGKHCSDEFRLHEYFDEHVSSIRLHWILPSHGGGAKDDQKFVAVNKLASTLLARGIAVADTADYAQKVASSVSSGKLLHELSVYEKTKGWEKLKDWLKGLGMPVPNANPSIEKAAIKIQQVMRKKKVHHEQHVKSDDFQICPDHFRKHDGTPALVLNSLLGAKTGVILLDPEEAKSWISKPAPIVSDSLACIVVGHQCPCEDKMKCRRIALPVHDKLGQPSVIAGCLHQLGDKDIELPKDHVSKVVVTKSTICGFTIFRDECDEHLWDRVLESPVKSVFKLLSTDLLDDFIVASPWGRSWKNDRVVCAPSEAMSFQFHARIREDCLRSVMSASGLGPIYVTPKDENKGLLKGWAVVWMKGSKKDVLILVTSNDIQHHGVVRTAKGFGVRVEQKDFEDCFKTLRPNDRVPTSIPATHLCKLQPLPVGMTAEAVENFTKEQGWPTRALKAIGHDTWMVASEAKCDKTWLRLNEQVVLVKPIQQSSQQSKPIVLAGTSFGISAKDQEPSRANDPWLQDKHDPWLKYKQASGHHSSLQSSANVSGTHQLTMQDPSLAKKLHEQDTHIKSLQQTVDELKVMQQKAEDNSVSMQQDMDSKFQKIRSDVSSQMQVLSNSFQHSLTSALAKQDKQINNGFDEIKALLASSMAESSAKKQKLLPKGKGKSQEVANPDDDEDAVMGASPLKAT